MSISFDRTTCAICNFSLEHIYDTSKIPVILSCVDDISKTDDNIMSFSICKSCNTMQLDKLINLDILYSISHNTTSVGKTWENYFNLFIGKINDRIEDKNILEIGCPSGKLAMRCDNYKNWFIVDPNKNDDIKFKDNIIFVKGFFDDSFNLEDNVDVIIHSHLFEHIYEPNRFLKKCYEVLPADGEMIFGVPNMQNMVDKTLFVGIFFEHTIFLNKENISYLLNKNGFEIVEIIDYENHSTIYHTKKSTNVRCLSPLKIDNYKDVFFSVVNDYRNFIDRCNVEINNNKASDIYIFGASYNTQHLLFLGLKREYIKGILDNCKEKQGKYLYGTALKIYDPKELINTNNVIVIVKNGYYAQEVCSQLLSIDNKITIIK